MFSCEFVLFLCFFLFVSCPPTSQPPQCFSQATQCPSNSVEASSQHVPARKENGHLSTFSSPLSGSQWEIYLHLLLLHWIRGKYRVTCTNLSASSCQMLAFMFGKVEYVVHFPHLFNNKNKCQSEAIVTVSGYYPPLVTTCQFDKFTHPDWLVNSSEPAKARYPDGFDRSNASDKVVNIIVLCDQIFLR